MLLAFQAEYEGSIPFTRSNLFNGLQVGSSRVVGGPMRGFCLFVVFLPSARSGPSRSTIADKAEAREADQHHRPG
jgi:hypothetical protein